MKKRLMASLLTLCMLLTLLPATALAAGTGAFTDVAEDAWYYDEVQFVKDEGLMNGVGGSQFGPELTVTRAMMVTMLWRMAGSPKAEGTQFTDVAAGQYYADAALWACANGIANGCGDSTFKPDHAITREQMAAFMYRYADYKGYDMDAAADLSKFSDASAVSEYAEAAMAWANAEGLITGMGDGALAPQGSATRAQVAAILYRFCTLLDGEDEAKTEFTVTFDWNHSDKGAYKTVTVKTGETVNKPSTPPRAGYSFGGWYTKAEGGEKFDFDTEIDKDVTLYAHWTKSSGGSSSHTHDWSEWVSNNDGTHTRTCSKNSNHKETENCTLKGYEPCSNCGWTDGKYHISTAEELTAFAAAVNGGEDFSGKTVVLDADVALAEAWTPIGNSQENTFSGTFDGQGNTISGLTAEGTEYVGLFGVVYGTVKNVVLDGAAISGSHFVGGIAGYLKSGEISGCSVTNSTITATPDGTDSNFDNGDKVGGIVGYAYHDPDGHAAITDCTVSGLTLAAYRDVGGIVGAGNGEDVTGCTATDVTITVDQKTKPYGTKAPNADGILGRNLNGTAVNGNTQSDIEITTILDIGDDVVAMVGDKTYTDWNLALKEASSGATITVMKGTHALTSDATGKTLTIIGMGDDVVIDCTKVIALHGSSIAFRDLTIQGVDANYIGLQHTSSISYTNCTIKSRITLYADTVTFTDCTFEGTGDYLCTYGSDDVTFTNCVFNNTNSKAILVYQENDTAVCNVTLNDCTFTAAEKAYTGSGDWTAAVEIDSSLAPAKVVINNCTADENYSGLVRHKKGSDATIIVDGVTLLADGLTYVEETKTFTVLNENGLVALPTYFGVAHSGDQTVEITTDLDMSGVAWTPIKVNGYNGADIMTVEGKESTITGLSAPLFAGGFAGGSGIVIKDLTIADSNIVSANTLGSGAFIESVDSMAKIELTNCHLLNSTLTGGNDSRTGGLIGWTAGYNNVNDGPVKTYVDITNCSVIGNTITSNGSVGGIYGHAGNNAWTYSTVSDCTVKDNTLLSTNTDTWRVGVVVGTANVGELTISNITESGNTLIQSGKTAPEGQSSLYGRFVPGKTGKLVIDGVVLMGDDLTFDTNTNTYNVSSQTAFETALSDAASAEGEITLAVEGVELGWETGAAHGSTPFLDENATVETVVIDGGENGATLTATGAGVGPIRAANGGTLVFKNITFVDESKSYAEGSWEFGYLEMGGKLVFEDCTFADPIQLETGAEATFTDCSFEGKTVDGLTMYAVWVGGGSATFTGCTFEGTRGIKIHEAYGSDVTEVIIDGCTFDSLSEKPGVAIGTVDETTVITITNSTFTGCKAGDQGLYIYETDTDVTTFDFTESGNTVE